MKKMEITLLTLILVAVSLIAFPFVEAKPMYHTSTAHGKTLALHIAYDREGYEQILSYQEEAVIDFDWRINMKKDHPKFGWGTFTLRKGSPQDPNSFIVDCNRIDTATFTPGDPGAGTFPMVEFSGYGTRTYQDGDEAIQSWIFVRAWDSGPSPNPDRLEIEVHDGDQVTRHDFDSDGFTWIQGNIIIDICHPCL